MGKFSFENLWSEKSTDTPRKLVNHAEYDFAVAYPPPEAIPMDGLIDGLKTIVDAKSDEVAKNMSYYPHVQGEESLRELTAEKIFVHRGIKTDKESIVLCNGSGEAKGLIIQAIINPGDYVITEEYVYMGTTNQLNYYEANILGTKIDDKGLITEKLEETFPEKVKSDYEHDLLIKKKYFSKRIIGCSCISCY